MGEIFVARASEFKEGDSRIVLVGGEEIGVFHHAGQFDAYSNICLHQGGPACEGMRIAKVEEEILPDKTSGGLYLSDTEMHFVCPWHGMEYDMKTGECVSDRRRKLKKYDVALKRTRSMWSSRQAQCAPPEFGRSPDQRPARPQAAPAGDGRPGQPSGPRDLGHHGSR
jgi:nitrite reductase/ring-hydroxylating ferredoxin subunit